MFFKPQVNIHARNFVFNRSQATRATVIAGVLNKLDILYKNMFIYSYLKVLLPFFILPLFLFYLSIVYLSF